MAKEKIDAVKTVDEVVADLLEMTWGEASDAVDDYIEEDADVINYMGRLIVSKGSTDKIANTIMKKLEDFPKTRKVILNLINDVLSAIPQDQEEEEEGEE